MRLTNGRTDIETGIALGFSHGRRKIYLAGAISGHDINERITMFAERKRLLEKAGYEVVNPLEVHPLGIPWTDALRADLRAMMDCEAIYLQTGWEKSSGVRLELNVALSLGFDVLVEGCDA